MRSKIIGRLTYANVMVTVALVFAISGGAYATGTYLITSSDQISPQALEQISTRTSGDHGRILAHGASETGVWGFAAYKPGLIREPLTFPIPLPAPIGEDNVVVLAPGQEGGQAAEDCPGTVTKPLARPGFLCLYSERLEVGYLGDGQPHVQGIVLGFFATAEATELGGFNDEGTWAVTAA